MPFGDCRMTPCSKQVNRAQAPLQASSYRGITPRSVAFLLDETSAQTSLRHTTKQGTKLRGRSTGEPIRASGFGEKCEFRRFSCSCPPSLERQEPSEVGSAARLRSSGRAPVDIARARRTPGERRLIVSTSRGAEELLCAMSGRRHRELRVSPAGDSLAASRIFSSTRPPAPPRIRRSPLRNRSVSVNLDVTTRERAHQAYKFSPSICCSISSDRERIRSPLR